MSIKIVNGFNGAVTVAGGGLIYQLPTGFNGSLTLAGHYTVTGAGQQVTIPVPTYTNAYCSSFTFNNQTGDEARVMVGTNGVQFIQPVDAPYGSSLFIEFGPLGSGNLWTAGTVPNGSAAFVLTANGHPENPPVPFSVNNDGTTYRDAVGTNMVVTNTTSTPLGTFFASPSVRTVEVHSAGLQVTDFSNEATAATAGFILAITIAVFRFGLRLVRGFADNGGDL